MAACTGDFSRSLSKSQVISRKCDRFIALFAPVVIGRCNYFGIGFQQSLENRSNYRGNTIQFRRGSRHSRVFIQ